MLGMSWRVLVLLSTYNGDKYIKEQLISLLNQKNVDVHVLIRDDASKDNTVPIIESMQIKNSNIILIKGDNVGCSNSFLCLMRIAMESYPNYDYYCFCDQDDIWLDDKIYSAIVTIDEKRKLNKFVLYLGAYQMVDAKLNPIVTRITPPRINLPSAIAMNSATGCTMLFNKELLHAIASKRPENILIHDYWTYLVCLSINGYVYYDNTPHILYRQHGSNVIGGRGDSFIKRWLIRISKLFKKGDYYKSQLANQLLHYYNEELVPDNKAFLEDVVSCNKLTSKFRLLKNKQFRCNSLDINLRLFGLILTGKL